MTHAKPRPFTLDELRAYLAEIFPEFWNRGDLRVEAIAPMSATVRLVHHPRNLRPGGTISGPAMFAVCDAALFVAILGEKGRLAQALTTSASINFLRKPAPADLIGQARRSSSAKGWRLARWRSIPTARARWSPIGPEPTRSRRAGVTR